MNPRAIMRREMFCKNRPDFKMAMNKPTHWIGQVKVQPYTVHKLELTYTISCPKMRFYFIEPFVIRSLSLSPLLSQNTAA
jgi:hypothetical protein